MLNMIRQLRLKDAWYTKHKNIEYTYVRNNYGSRLDRLYVRDIANWINDIKTINVNFSDHSGILMHIEIPNEIKTGKFYWKLNVSLLKDDNIKSKFKNEWEKIKGAINNYDSINNWWNMYAKSQIKKFFVNIGKEENIKKYGRLE